ncbi:tetratricopeptide repeat protein [bacterium]|nr:tetratricopeptide repeat protein [bacterium]
MAEETVVPVDCYNESSGFILEGRYDEAEHAVDRFIGENPDEPAGPLLKAAVLHYRCIDYDDFSRDEEYRKLLDTAVKLAEAKIKRNGHDLWARYFYNSARSLDAVWSVTNGSFIAGVTRGMSGARGMSEIISDDKEFYDAYLMVGAYRFWKSVSTEKIDWLPFIRDKRDRGLAEVNFAIARGTLNGALSNTVLIEMLLAHDPDDAVALCETMVDRYPACRLFAWQLGEAYKRAGRYEDAVRVLTGLAATMERDPADDGSGPLRCWWKLAVLAQSMKKNSDCGDYCNRIVTLGQKKTVYDRQRKRIEGARKMLGELADE